MMTMKSIKLILFVVLLLAGCDSSGPGGDGDDGPEVINGTRLTMKVDGDLWRSAVEVEATVFTTNTGVPFWLTVVGAGLPIPPIYGRAFLLTVTLDEGFLAPDDYTNSMRYVEAIDADNDAVFLGEGAGVRITVTERTETQVKGTFSGTLTLEDGEVSITITEGSFVANIEEVRALPL